MRRLAAAALLLLFATPGQAAVFGRNRMHLLSPRMEAKLTPETRANLRRTLSLNGGTAFLVSVTGGKGLVMTNEHVVRGQGAGARITFYEGDRPVASAPTGRVLSQSEKLDYALVEVDLSALPAKLVGTAAKLRDGAVRPGEHTYKVGFPALSLLETPAYGNFDWTVNDRKQRFGSQPKRMVISAGHEIGGGKVKLFHDPDPRPGHRAAVPRYSIALDDSSLPGNSGSPVFSAVTHEVVALHWAGGTSRVGSDPALHDGDRWDSANYAVPMSKVLDHLRTQLEGGALPVDVRAQVGALTKR